MDQDGQELALLYLLLYVINNTHRFQVEDFCKNFYLKMGSFDRMRSNAPTVITITKKPGDILKIPPGTAYWNSTDYL